MNQPEKSVKSSEDAKEVLRRLQQTDDLAITEHIRKLKESFGKYATSPEQTRKTIDKAMGQHTLTEILIEIRTTDANN